MGHMIAETMPKFANNSERIAWAGDRCWDIAEGELDKSDATFVMWLVSGWVDSPQFSIEDRAKFQALLETIRATIDLRFGTE